ncbi:MAG: hypothetical protein ACXAEN_20200, partial [Candidatus Thorarchaeota archaeon]
AGDGYLKCTDFDTPFWANIYRRSNGGEGFWSFDLSIRVGGVWFIADGTDFDNLSGFGFERFFLPSGYYFRLAKSSEGDVTTLDAYLDQSETDRHRVNVTRDFSGHFMVYVDDRLMIQANDSEAIRPEYFIISVNTLIDYIDNITVVTVEFPSVTGVDLRGAIVGIAVVVIILVIFLELRKRRSV